MGSWELTEDADYYASAHQGESVVVEGQRRGEVDHTFISKKGVANQAWGVRSEAHGALWGGNSTLGMEYAATRRWDTFQGASELNLPSNNTQINEHLLALYAGHSMLLAGKIQCSFGLRMERVVSKYFSQGVHKPELSRKYFNIFPNFSLGARFGEVNMQLAFNSRIQRPQYWELRSDYSYISRFEYQTGDPNLRPELTYSTELTLNRKWVTLLLGHQYIKHSIQQITTRMPEPL